MAASHHEVHRSSQGPSWGRALKTEASLEQVSSSEAPASGTPKCGSCGDRLGCVLVSEIRNLGGQRSLRDKAIGPCGVGPPSLVAVLLLGLLASACCQDWNAGQRVRCAAVSL